MSSSITTFEFCTRPEYYEQLAELITKTKKGDRVVVATMSFKPSEPQVSLILELLCEASRRGVTVRFVVDSHSFMLGKGLIPGPLLLGKKLDTRSLKSFSNNLSLLEKLKSCSGQYTVANRPQRAFTNPFAGRSHIKFAVINDDVYIGGCNLKPADRTDIMVHWKQNKIANWLFEFADAVHLNNQVRTALNNKDLTIPVDNRSSLLVDAGVKGQSIIFENALRVIDEAEEYIVMACQYPPNGITANRLSKAISRGVEVRLVYNHPSKHDFPMSILHTAVKFFEKYKYPPVLFDYELSKKHDFLHAKLLATDKSCMIGSHNFVEAGVTFGTAEIALLRTDPKFSKDAVKALDKQL